MADLFPRCVRDPITAFPTFRVRLLTLLSQCFEVEGQSGMRLWGELQREALSSLAVCCHATRTSGVEGRNNRPMIRMMDQGRSERHLPEVPNILLPYQNVVRLGLIPSPHPLLAPCPSLPSSLHPTSSKGEFPR